MGGILFLTSAVVLITQCVYIKGCPPVPFLCESVPSTHLMIQAQIQRNTSVQPIISPDYITTHAVGVKVMGRVG